MSLTGLRCPKERNYRMEDKTQELPGLFSVEAAAGGTHPPPL